MRNYSTSMLMLDENFCMDLPKLKRYDDVKYQKCKHGKKKRETRNYDCLLVMARKSTVFCFCHCLRDENYAYV